MTWLVSCVACNIRTSVCYTTTSRCYVTTKSCYVATTRCYVDDRILWGGATKLPCFDTEITTTCNGWKKSCGGLLWSQREHTLLAFWPIASSTDDHVTPTPTWTKVCKQRGFVEAAVGNRYVYGWAVSNIRDGSPQTRTSKCRAKHWCWWDATLQAPAQSFKGELFRYSCVNTAYQFPVNIPALWGTGRISITACRFATVAKER